MDHAEARELLDIAAAEPGGLDRLVAGDTPSAHALAGHLAGCAECMEEFARLRRSTVLLRDVISTQLPPELRERTLAFVAAVGRPRGAPAGVTSAAVTAGQHGVLDPAPALAPAAGSAAADVVDLETRRSARSRRRGPLRWIAAAAAVAVLSAGVAGYSVAANKDASFRTASLQLEGLVEVAASTVRLDARPDVRHVVLTAASGATGTRLGSLVFSPAAQELVVVADGLAQPPAGQEYRCWVEVGGTRQRLGKMYMSGDLAYWVGPAAALANIPTGSTFGVSLADIAGAGGANPPILSGTLEST